MSKLQLTLAIIKPHAVKNPIAVTFIRQVLKNTFLIVRTKQICLSNKLASDFYKEHLGKFFYNRLVTFMASGSIDVHIMAHTHAIDQWRRMMGPTKVYHAQFDAPHSLRGLFGLSDTRNVAHGSDSNESAVREIKFFFPEFSFQQWHSEEEPVFRSGHLQFDDQLFQHVPCRKR